MRANPTTFSQLAETMMAEGVSTVEVQTRGNLAYQSLDTKEREMYQKRADNANSKISQDKESVVSLTKLVPVSQKTR